MEHSLLAEYAAYLQYIHISSKRLLTELYHGSYGTRSTGIGIDFNQIRQYQRGDDVRFIDWNASARFDTLLVKQFYQDSRRSVHIVVDISGSSFYGSGMTDKYQLQAKIAGVMAYVSGYAKDAVSLWLFAQQLETYIPAHTSMAHVHKILETLYTVRPKRAATDMHDVIQQLLHLKQRNSIVLIFSDMLNLNDEKSLVALTAMYEVIVVRCYDQLEVELPEVGLLAVEDIETGVTGYLDLRASGKQHLQDQVASYRRVQAQKLRTLGADVIDLSTKDDHAWIKKMIIFYQKRMTSKA